jgi:hypothetical protein
MNNNVVKPTVVVLAAGLGSRYGSLKQIDQFGPSGETIIDYSIYDAIRAGFGKVVFIIRRSIEAEFKEVFVDKFNDFIQMEYAFQEIDILPDGIKMPKDRLKPWGTGHAVLMAADKVNEPFAVINADDFYGMRSFQLLHDQLTKLDNSVLGACLIGYRLKNTLSEHGSVSRGICALTPDGFLEKVTERTKISKGQNGEIYFTESDKQVLLDGNELVSMNLVGFSPLFFDFLRSGFKKFATGNIDLKSEYFLPGAISSMIASYSVKIPVIETPDMTYGVTYQKDKPIVKNMIEEQVKSGKYPKQLWK